VDVAHLGSADEHVPYAGALRERDATWQQSLQQWLDGRILCEEAKRYVGNFLAVHRVRPQNDDSDDTNSDDAVSDEELEVANADLQGALGTRIGGRGKEDEEEEEGDAPGAHRENSRSGMLLAKAVWSQASQESVANWTQPVFKEVGNVDAIIDAARKSRSKEQSLTKTMQTAEERGPTVCSLSTATVSEVKTWLQNLQTRRTTMGGWCATRSNTQW